MNEWIEYRGTLDDQGHFEPLGTTSTQRPRRRSKPEGESRYRAELQDRDGKPLSEAAVSAEEPLHCHNFEVGRQILEGRLRCVDGAAKIALFDGDRLIDERELGPEPRLELPWTSRRVSRSRPARLGLKISKPQPDAFVVVSLEHAPDQFVHLGTHPPSRALKIDFAHLPGGKECRLHVTYTSGFRTARASTDPFELAPLPARVSIQRPSRGQKIPTSSPISVSGDVVDPQSRVQPQKLEWHLDGKPIGRGRHALLQGVPPGRHELKLVYDGDLQNAATQRFVAIAEASSEA